MVREISRYIGLVFVVVLLAVCMPQKVQAQAADTLRMENKTEISPIAADTSVAKVMVSADSLANKMKPAFVPSPKKAVLYALVPGLGQIYNRKYWKLPIVYGAFMGCMYAITWNNKNYKDYSSAYVNVVRDFEKVQEAQKRGEEYKGPWSDSWIAFVPKGSEEEYVMNTQFHDNLKRSKDYYRRYRDLSIFITVGVYALSMVDAYIDAQLFDFDISPDLSFHWSPEAAPKTKQSSSYYGLNCSFKF